MERTVIPWVLATFILGFARAVPVITFPLNSQLPPIARVNEPFSFEFSPQTFTSKDKISYTLSNSPTWLSVDSDSRKIRGTPKDGDIGADDVAGVPIELVAEDSTGSATLSATLVVSRNPAPKIAVPLSKQIEGFGAYTEPNSLLSYPSKHFMFTFDHNTFSTAGLDYYAVSGNNAPLPAWISFDATELTFRGLTPPLNSLIEPPETFHFQLVASDVTGFAAISVPFNIVVGNHEVTVDTHNITLNATRGEKLSYTKFQGDVRIDGNVAKPGDLSSASLENAPSWISFDDKTWEISGTPDADAKDTSFGVIFEDAYSDTTNVTVNVKFMSALFRDTLPDLEVKPGDKIDFDLKSHLANPSDSQVSVDISPSEDWLHFDDGALTISGEVPKDFTGDGITVAIKATSKSSGSSDIENLSIRVSSAASPTSSATATSSTTAPTASASDTSPAGPKPRAFNPTLLAILLPTLLLVAAFILLLFCLYRRRRRGYARSIDRHDITGPLPGSFVYGDGDSDLREMGRHYDMGRVTPSPEFGEKPYAVHAYSNLRRSRTNPDIPPVPKLPPLSAPGRMRTSISFGSPSKWFSGDSPISRMRRSIFNSKPKSMLSDGSFYDEDEDSLDLLFHAKDDNYFRSSLAANLPRVALAQSIQHTPVIAYGGHSPQQATVQKFTRASSSNKVQGLLDPLPIRTVINVPAKLSTRTAKRASRPVIHPPARVAQAMRAHGDPTYPDAMESIDTRSMPDPFVSGPVTPPELATQALESMVNRPRPSYPPRSRLPVYRPVSRRSDQAVFFAGSSESYRYRASPLPMPGTPTPAPLALKTKNPKRMDNLGVSQEEASSSPSTRSWGGTTAAAAPPSNREMSPTSQRPDSAGPNWTVLDISPISTEGRWVTRRAPLGESTQNSKGTPPPADYMVGRAVSRYSKSDFEVLDEEAQRENLVRSGSNGSGSGRSGMSDEGSEYMAFI